MQEGGEGEKSDLVSASQKALARAAQLVQDAAEMRKREAQAAIDRIDSQVRLHLCERLESMLPPGIAAAEIASIKGELLLSKVVGKASLSLDGIARSFLKTIRHRAWDSHNPVSKQHDRHCDFRVVRIIWELLKTKQCIALTYLSSATFDNTIEGYLNPVCKYIACQQRDCPTSFENNVLFVWCKQ